MRPAGSTLGALLVLALAFPAAASACGMCGMTVSQRQYWWMDAGGSVFLAFFLERLVFLLAYVRRDPTKTSLARALWYGSFGVGLGVVFLGFFISPLSSQWVFGALMLPAFVLSLVGANRLGLDLTRVALVVVLVGPALWSARPGARPTAQLVGLHSRHPVLWDDGFSSWGYSELKSRADARQEIERALSASRGDRERPDQPTSHELSLLRLHDFVTGDEGFRRTFCPAGTDLSRARPRVPDAELRRLCPGS